MFDRQEVDVHGADAAAAFTDNTGTPVYPIITATDILDYLSCKGLDEQRDSIQTYLNQYGIASVRK